MATHSRAWQSIKRRFYRQPVSHFLTPEEYFGRYLGERGKKSSITHETKCVGREKELDEIISAIDSGNISVVHVTAPPGHGKSRLALELTRLLRGQGRGFLWGVGRWLKGARWQSYFVRSNTNTLLDHVNELRKKGNVALFVDDAHEMLGAVSELAQYIGLPGSLDQTIIVCLSRSTLSHLVTDILSDIPSEDMYALRVSKLSRDQIHEVVVNQLPNEIGDVQARVTDFAQDSAFLAVLVCQLVRREVDIGEAVSTEAIRRKICDFPIEQAVSTCGIPTYNAILGAAALSAAAPVDHTNSSIRAAVCKLADISEVSYSCLISRLVESGLFLTYAKSMLRPAPDLIGALIIDSACIENGGTNLFSRHLLNELLEHCSVNILNNLSGIGWTVGLSEAVDVVGPIIEKITESLDSENPEEALTKIQILEPLALRRAPQVVAFFDAAWRITKDSIQSGSSKVDAWSDVIDSALPLLTYAAHDRRVSTTVLTLLKEIVQQLDTDTVFKQSKPQSILAELVGFSGSRSISQTEETLSVIEKWFRGGDADAVIALRSLGVLLSSTLSTTESQGFTFTWKSSLIALSDQITAIRKRAIDLILDGISSSDSGIQSEAILMAEGIGESRGGPRVALNEDWRELVESERLRVLDVILDTLSGQKQNLRDIRIEQLTWAWWRESNEQTAARCEQVLVSIQDDEHYRIFKCLYSGEIPVSPIAAILNNDKELTRSSRFFSVKRDTMEYSSDYIEDLVCSIGLSDDPTDWLKFMTDIEDSQLTPSWRAHQIFQVIAQHYPRTGWSLFALADGSLSTKFKPSLLTGCRMGDWSRWNRELSAVLATGKVETGAALDWQSSVDWKGELSESVWELIDQCIVTDDNWLLERLSGNMSHGRDEDWLNRCRKLLQIAQAKPENATIVDHLFVALSRARPANRRSELLDVDCEALEFLMRDDLDVNIPWYEPHWVGSYFAFVAELDSEVFIKFILRWASGEDEHTRMHLSTLGTINATSAFKILTDGEKRGRVVGLLFDWAIQDNALGEFAGSVMSSIMNLTDDSVVAELSRLYDSRSYLDIARIVHHFELDEEWLCELGRLVEHVDRDHPDHFDEVVDLLSDKYWAGVRRRTPGRPGRREELAAGYFKNRLKETNLSPRVREYFELRHRSAVSRTEADFAEDERLIGRPL